MWILAHMGIGAELAKPWSSRLKLRFIFLGTLLPDLIDKPLYYLLSWTTNKRGAELGLISGTRTFGHTALFLLALAIFSYGRRSKKLAAVALGVATHLLLDNVGDRLLGTDLHDFSPLLWPFTTRHFPIHPFQNFEQHLRPNHFVVACEILGAMFLLWQALRRGQLGHRIRVFGRA